MSYNRSTLELLSDKRLAEAKVLLANDCPSGAYYLAGYAVECALKAILARRFRAEELPDRRLVEQVYVHNLAALLRLAELEPELDQANANNPRLVQNWNRVKVWTERARYQIWTEQDASDMIAAIDSEEGVRQWLRNR